jgi:hypothetical protein
MGYYWLGAAAANWNRSGIKHASAKMYMEYIPRYMVHEYISNQQTVASIYTPLLCVNNILTE